MTARIIAKTRRLSLGLLVSETDTLVMLVV